MGSHSCAGGWQESLELQARTPAQSLGPLQSKDQQVRRGVSILAEILYPNPQREGGAVSTRRGQERSCVEPGWPSWVPTGAPYPEVTEWTRAATLAGEGCDFRRSSPSVGGLGYTARSASKGGIREWGELRVAGGRARLSLRPWGQVRPQEAQAAPHPPFYKLPARPEGACAEQRVCGAPAGSKAELQVSGLPWGAGSCWRLPAARRGRSHASLGPPALTAERSGRARATRPAPRFLPQEACSGRSHRRGAAETLSELAPAWPLPSGPSLLSSDGGRELAPAPDSARAPHPAASRVSNPVSATVWSEVLGDAPPPFMFREGGGHACVSATLPPGPCAARGPSQPARAFIRAAATPRQERTRPEGEEDSEAGTLRQKYWRWRGNPGLWRRRHGWRQFFPRRKGVVTLIGWGEPVKRARLRLLDGEEHEVSEPQRLGGSRAGAEALSAPWSLHVSAPQEERPSAERTGRMAETLPGLRGLAPRWADAEHPGPGGGCPEARARPLWFQPREVFGLPEEALWRTGDVRPLWRYREGKQPLRRAVRRKPVSERRLPVADSKRRYQGQAWRKELTLKE